MGNSLNCKECNQKNRNYPFFSNPFKKNKITLFYKIEKPNEKIRLFGSDFFERNKEYCKMIVNFIKFDILEFYKTDEEELKITLEINKEVTDISHMFDGCSALKKIPDFNNLNTSNITNISYLFYGCTSLESIPIISDWDTTNITDMSFLFYRCCSLKSLPDISTWRTYKVTDMSYIFYECSSLKSIPNISYWNTDKVKNMKSMFSFASSLKNLPKLNSWNTKNVVNISCMFYGCSSLEEIEGIEDWITNNVTDISFIFCKCTSLKRLSDISKWNTSNVKNMSHMFYDCSSLTSMHIISEWNTENVIDMSYMFYNCSNLTSFPYYISNWKTDNVKNMSYMFYNCRLLNDIDDISNWNTDKVTDITMIFYNCPLENKIDISKWKCYNKKITQILDEVENDKDINNINNMNNINNINNISTNEYKIEEKVLVENNDFEFLPHIELKFNNVNKYSKELFEELKKEIKKLLNTDNFNIIEFRKGSLTVVLTLQHFIFKNFKKNIDNDPAINVTDSFFDDINSELKSFAQKIKNHCFISLGSTKPDSVEEEIIDFKNEENKKKIQSKILGIARNANKDEHFDVFKRAKTFELKMDDIEKYFNKKSCEAAQKEDNIKKFINKSEKYNKIFDEEIEKAFKESIFEYKIVHILIVEKEDTEYLSGKSKCPNKTTKLLFHGTNVDAITGILSDQFRHAEIHIFGIGTYFTDCLDYAWFYAGEKKRGNCRRIPEPDDTFSCVASEIYYDKAKLEIVYNCNTKDKKVEENGIRCAYANYNTTIMNQNDLKDYKGFIGNEFLLTDKKQYLPIYGVTFQRVEYLIIWRDYNFNKNNVNKYNKETFTIIQNFHKKIKKYILRELESRVYFIDTTAEALNLINRKKYNKIIIITNGNNNAKYFITKAREIIGSNPIAAVSALDVKKHITWVKDMENVLLLYGMDYHKKFINCIKKGTNESYEQLRKEIIDNYSSSIANFDLSISNDNLFKFPKFKVKGSFRDLNFDINTNTNNADIHRSLQSNILDDKNNNDDNLLATTTNININNNEDDNNLNHNIIITKNINKTSNLQFDNNESQDKIDLEIKEIKEI